MAYWSCVIHLWDVEVLKGNKKLTDNIWFIHVTIIPRCALDMRWQIANSTLRASLAIIMSYPTSTSGIIVLLKTPTKSRWISPTRTNGKRQGTSAIYMSHVYQNCQRANGLDEWTIKTLWRWTLLKTHRDSRILHNRTAKKLADDENKYNF